MVKFIESELILLKKEIDEMWTLVYNQLDRAGEAVLTLDKELAQQVMVRERRVNAFELKIDSDVEDIIALFKQHDKNVFVEEIHNGEFDYLIRFSEENEDPYYYCFHDEGCHIIYHRFLPEDYEDFGF